MWQEVIVGLCVIAAVVFLLRRWLPILNANSRPGCGGCGGCDTAKSCNNPAGKSSL